MRISIPRVVLCGLLVMSLNGACSSEAERVARASVEALDASAQCPPGMVLVQGSGRVGLNPGRYALVQTRGRAEVVAPQSECPAALEQHPDPIACWIQTDLVDPVLRPRDVWVEPVCVDAFPFPGEGAAYTEDGMTAWDAMVLQKLLARGDLGGRRLCTATELQAAIAGLQANRPFIYGSAHDPERCPPGQLIGHDPLCGNPETGIREFGAIHSHWVLADAPMVDRACDHPPCRAAGNRLLEDGMLIVLGGTSRLQTRQAPLSPHTWHDHGRPAPSGCDDMGHDDQPAICADPSPLWGRHDRSMIASEARWQELVHVARSTGRVDRMLDAAVGGPSCPGDATTAATPAGG